ncbi:hypothetical protein EDD15DRAFT_2367774 [Pisolithus albus]|nr:hypothetical protein EDD15DRAFT_2367774 [Pisolithus albus]
MTTFRNLSFEHENGGTAIPANVDYDRQLNTPSAVQEIEALQVKLDALEDEDEQRVLEEDITGKARIAFSYYFSMLTVVHSFIDPMALLMSCDMIQVVDYLRREGNMEDLREMCWIMLRQMHTRELSTEPGDDQAHLRRIMLDAGARTSKHQLLLAARAAEQVKWSSANESSLAADNQGTAPSAPSVSVV